MNKDDELIQEFFKPEYQEYTTQENTNIIPYEEPEIEEVITESGNIWLDIVIKLLLSGIIVAIIELIKNQIF